MLDKTYLDSASLVKIGFIQHSLQFSISHINLYQTLIVSARLPIAKTDAMLPSTTSADTLLLATVVTDNK